MSEEKKERNVPVKKKRKETKKPKQPTDIVPRRSSFLWTDFDQIFEDFRRGFENLFFPLRTSTEQIFPLTQFDIRVPATDLVDRGTDFLLKTELPGFKKEDNIDIEVTEDSIKIDAIVGWEYDKESRNYICKERECKSFFREESLPEEVDTEKVTAKLEDGILEVILPKKAPKKKKKISIK